MQDITDKLRRWKELKPLYDSFAIADFWGDVSEWPDGLKVPERVGTKEEARAFLLLDKELRQLAEYQDTVVISDTALQQIFSEIWKRTADSFYEDEKNDVVTEWASYTAMMSTTPQIYIKGLVKTRPLILLYPPSPEINKLVTEARQCICFDVPTAAIAVCRAIVEAAVVDIAIRAGRIRPDQAVEEMRMCEKISALLGTSISRKSPIRRNVNVFIDEASQVIHVTREADQDLAIRLFGDALKVVQELYGYYRPQIGNSPNSQSE